MTPAEFLESECTIDGFGTWRLWFIDVLDTLLDEGEGFSGKRPNCDSGWENKLAEAFATIDTRVVRSWYEANEEECEPRTAKDVDWKRFREVGKAVVRALCHK